MDRVLTAVERTALRKRMLYSDFAGGRMIGIYFGVGICRLALPSGERAALMKKEKGSLCEEES
jgi:hypothetical protein